MAESLLTKKIKPDGEAFVNCVRRKGTPARVHNAELYLDKEIEDVLCKRFNILDGISQSDPQFEFKRRIAIYRTLGYDYICAVNENSAVQIPTWDTTNDTADLKKGAGRRFVNSHKGVISSWEEFEKYSWPDPSKITTKGIEWFQKNLPDDMIIIGGLTGHFCEELTWLMGYETLCVALFEQRDLVKAIADKLSDLYVASVTAMLQYDRIEMIWASDDMGFKTGLLIGPDDMREFVLTNHNRLARLTHDAGKLYLLHNCGKLDDIMDDLINVMHLDVKHSFEDTIQDVREAKKQYGSKLSFFGGIDVDFLCRSTPQEIRKRVRDTIEVCQPGGGWCLGTGNSVANYIPVDNYLTMLDEGRNYTG